MNATPATPSAPEHSDVLAWTALAPHDPGCFLAALVDELEGRRPPALPEDLVALLAQAEAVCRDRLHNRGPTGEVTADALATSTSWGTLALLRWLQRDLAGALDAAAHLIALEDGARTAALAELERAARRLHKAVPALPGWACLERLILLGRATHGGDEEARLRLRELSSQARVRLEHRPGGRAAILAGATDAGLQAHVERFAPVWRRAVAGLRLALISGGTDAGVCRVAAACGPPAQGRILTLGYRSKHLPAPASRSAGFKLLVETEEPGFTPLDSLQAWTDLLAAGADPARVLLVAYAPGPLARLEIAVALALGATVGAIEDPLLPAERRFRDAAWTDHPRCLPLPLDAMCLQALLMGTQSLTAGAEARLASAARLAHEDYRAAAPGEDPARVAWEDLPEDLRRSNVDHVSFWEQALGERGNRFRLRLEDAPAAVAEREPVRDLAALLDAAVLDEMAELEHGRFVVERLRQGWRPGPVKDPGRRHSPWLVAWGEVPEQIRRHDRAAVFGLPGRLRAAGRLLRPDRAAELDAHFVGQWEERARCASAGTPWAREADFDADDVPERTAIQPLPLLREALGEIEGQIRAAWVSCGAAAESNRRRHWLLSRVAITCGVLAIIMAILQLGLARILPRAAETVLVVECLLVAAGAVAVVLGRWRKHKRAWLVNRHKAERLRMLKFSMLLHPDLWRHRPAWRIELRRRFEGIVGIDGDEAVRAWAEEDRLLRHDQWREEVVPELRHGEEFQGVLAYCLHKRLRYQRDYLCRASERAKAELVGGAWFSPEAFFLMTVALVILHVVLELALLLANGHGGAAHGPGHAALHHAGVWALMAAASLPLVGILVKYLNSTFESARRAESFHAKAAALREIGERLNGEDLAVGRALFHLDQVEHLLELEHADWLRAQLDAEWFL